MLRWGRNSYSLCNFFWDTALVSGGIDRNGDSSIFAMQKVGFLGSMISLSIGQECLGFPARVSVELYGFLVHTTIRYTLGRKRCC